jgi:alpha-L-arabinofuranosidase
MQYLKIANAVKASMIDYFTNTINSDQLIDRVIKPLVKVSEKQQERVKELLQEAHDEFADWLHSGDEDVTIEEIRRLENLIDEKYSLKIQEIFV